MLGPQQYLYVGEMLSAVVDDEAAVGIDHDEIDLGYRGQRTNNVVVQRNSSQWTVILANDALAIVTHRYNGDCSAHCSLSVGELGIFGIDNLAARRGRGFVDL